MADPRWKIAVADDWQRLASQCADWPRLRGRARVTFFNEPFPSEDAAANALAAFDVIVPMRERLSFTSSLLTRLPRLKLLALTGMGTRHVDMMACARQNIVCCGSGAYSPTAAAELTMALMLAAQRHVALGDAAIRFGGFQAAVPLGQTLEGLTLGVIGLGKIGGRVCTYAQAFGMKVLAWSSNLTTEKATLVGAQYVSKAELLRSSDIITLHLVLSVRSRATIDADALALMKRGVLLVNTARAQLIDEGVLLASLQTGRVRAALDVFDEEPLPKDHPLRSAPNTVLTPHLGFNTRRTFEEFYRQSLENVEAFLSGQPIRVLGR